MDLYSDRCRSDTKFILETLIPYLETRLDEKSATTIVSQGDPHLDTIPWLYALRTLFQQVEEPRKRSFDQDSQNFQDEHDANTSCYQDSKLTNVVQRLFVFCQHFNFQLSMIKIDILIDLVTRVFRLSSQLNFRDRAGFLGALKRIVTHLDSRDPSHPVITRFHCTLMRMAERANNAIVVEKLLSTRYAGTELNCYLEPRTLELLQYFASSAELLSKLHRYEECVDALIIAMSISNVEAPAKMPQRLARLMTLASLASEGRLTDLPKCVQERYRANKRSFERREVGGIGRDIATTAAELDMTDLDDDGTEGASGKSNEATWAEGESFTHENTLAPAVHPNKVHKTRRSDVKNRLESVAKVGIRESEDNYIPGQGKIRDSDFCDDLVKAFNNRDMENAQQLFKLHGESIIADSDDKILMRAMQNYKERYVSRQINTAFKSLNVRMLEKSQLSATSDGQIRQLVCEMLMRHRLETCVAEFTSANEMNLHSVGTAGNFRMAEKSAVSQLDEVISRLMEQTQLADAVALEVTANNGAEIQTALRGSDRLSGPLAGRGPSLEIGRSSKSGEIGVGRNTNGMPSVSQTGSSFDEAQYEQDQHAQHAQTLIQRNVRGVCDVLDEEDGEGGEAETPDDSDVGAFQRQMSESESEI